MNDKIIFEGRYNSTVPLVRDGEHKWYSKSGEVRKEVIYKEGKIGNATAYYSNGKIHYQYRIVEEGIQHFNSVKDIDGNDLLDDLGNGNEVIFDKVNNRNLTFKFKKGRLVESFFHDDNNRKIYQKCNSNAYFKKSKTEMFKNLVELKDKLNTVDQYADDFLLFKCIVEDDGMVSNLELVKGIDTQIDRLALEYMRFFETERYLNPAIVDGKKVVSEVVIPLIFQIGNSTSEHSNSVRPFYDFGWMGRQMFIMQQQILHHNHTAPKIPSIN